MDEFLKIVKELRSENGCPWDRKQTIESMSKYLLEEAAEATDAVSSGNLEDVEEELGDLLLVITMIAEILSEKNGIDFNTIVKKISKKMIRRHPHVFGNEKITTADEVVENWNKIKSNGEHKPLFFENVSKSLHPFEISQKLQKDASKYGFDWHSKEPVIDKVKEELGEFLDSIDENPESSEEEFGDIIFSLINLSRFMDIDPTLAIRKCNNKFIKRLKYIKKAAFLKHKKFEDLTFQEMDSLWEEAKDNL